MLALTAAPKHYVRAGLALLAAFFGLFALGLPPFQVGLWAQTEPILLGFLCTSLLACVWLVAGLLKGWLTPQSPHPLWLCLLLWLGWQLIATALSPAPVRSWFGNPQTAEGTAWYLILLLIAALAVPLCGQARNRRIILWVAAIGAAALTLLQWVNPAEAGYFDDQRWTPAQYPFYLAFIIAYGWIAAVIAAPVKRFRGYALLAALMGVMLFVSKNKSGMALFPLPVLAAALLGCSCLPRPLRRFFHPNRAWRIVLTAACLLPMAFIALSPAMPGLHATHPESAVLTLLADGDSSLGSRVLLNEASLSAMAHEPLRWLAGGGWGGSFDTIFAYALVPGTYLWQHGQSSPSSSLLQSSAYHTHSEPLEVLLSLGLPGLMLWLAIPAVAILTLPRRLFWPVAPVLAASIMLQYFWFQLLIVLPYEALCFALICALPHARKKTPRKNFWLAGLGCAGVALALSVAAQESTITYGMRMQQTVGGGNTDSGDWMQADGKLGGYRFRGTTAFYADWLAAQSRAGKTTQADADMFARYLHTADAFLQLPSVGPGVALTDTVLRFQLLTGFAHDPLFAPLVREAGEHMEEPVLQLVREAPLRDDLTYDYIHHLADFTRHDAQAQETILNKILALAPQNRPALWALGHLRMAQPGHEQEGLDMIRRAVSTGLQSVTPLTDEDVRPYQ